MKLFKARGAADSRIVTNDVFVIATSIGRFAGSIVSDDFDPGVLLRSTPGLRFENNQSPRSGRQPNHRSAFVSEPLSVASRAQCFLFGLGPGVSLRSTPGFMLSSAPRTDGFTLSPAPRTDGFTLSPAPPRALNVFVLTILGFRCATPQELRTRKFVKPAKRPIETRQCSTIRDAR